MPIINRDRYPDVTFFPATEIKQVGTVGIIPLVQVGVERSTGAAVVAKAATNDPATEDLFATPLYELLGQSQDQISITNLEE